MVTSRVQSAQSGTIANDGVRVSGDVGPFKDVSKGTPINATLDLGIQIREVRKAMKLSQQSFADLAGVGRRFVSELEAGKSSVEFERVLKVCKAAGIDIFMKPRSAAVLQVKG